MKLTICEFKDNFLGSSNGEGIDLDKSIENYQGAVAQRLSTYDGDAVEIRWDVRSGEGDPSRYFSVEGYDGDENELKETVQSIGERVFSEGAFWVNA